MNEPAAEQLLHIDASDGLALCGAMFGPNVGAGSAAVVLSHGSGARFCDRTYVGLGRALAGRGHRLLSGDTRGHDVAAVQLVSGQPMAMGAAFEHFERSVADVAAWLSHVRRIHTGRVVAAGHSMGASKTVLAHSSTPADALILFSPPVAWPDNAPRVEVARRMVADGRGDQLMPPHPDAPPWNLISAATLDERACLIENVFAPPESAWSGVDVPTLVVFGAAEDNIDAAIAVLRAGWSSAQALTCQVIDGAAHDYDGHIDAVAAVVADWLAGLDQRWR